MNKLVKYENKALVIGDSGSGLKTIIHLLMKEQHPITFGRLTPIHEKIITEITDTSPKLNCSGFRVMAEEVSSFTRDDIDLLLDSPPIVHPLFCNTCGHAKYISNCDCINKEEVFYE